MKMKSQNLRNMEYISVDNQELLLEYVTKNDISGISNMVRNEGVQILQQNYENYDKPILHIACDDKADVVSPSTVETLINLGADIYAPIVAQREAIHSAVCGQNPQILRTVIEMIDCRNKLNATTKRNTALNLLIKNDKKHHKSFQECLLILLEADIDVNQSDRNDITPILWACVKENKDAIRAILECGKYVDIDTHIHNGKTARNYITDNNLYDGDLPEKQASENNDTTTESASWYILNDNETGFLKLHDLNPDEAIKNGTLLQLACERKLLRVVKHLVKCGADVNRTTKKNTKLPLQIAAEYGRYRIFKILLCKYTHLPEGILTTLLTNMTKYEDNNTNYRKCLNMVLDSEIIIPIYETSDSYNTPLHYAGLIADTNISLKLLKKGASLANENAYKSIPIEDIDPNILEEHFDNCITVKEFRSNKRNVVFNFDYSSILPTVTEQMTHQDKNIELLTTKIESTFSETGVIRVLSEIPEMHHLLVHPLIASFIDIKWHRMRWFFWINLMFFLAFAISFFAYAFIPTKKVPMAIVWPILIVTYMMEILKELTQLLLSAKTFCSLSNIIEIIMLTVSLYPIFFETGSVLHKEFSSVAIIFIAIKLMKLSAQHPHWSTYVVILQTVAKNFFYFLILYIILILTFAVCFYNLFNTNNNQETTNNSYTDDACKTDDQNFFNELGLTMIKTIVMLTGEFDASSIKFNSFWNRIIFLLFVLLIPIVLFNLLNGLAVSDTQQIKSEAEVIGYIERVNYIVYHENIILGNVLTQHINDLFQNHFVANSLYKLSDFLKHRISLVPESFSNNISKKIQITLRRGELVVENVTKSSGVFNFSHNYIDKKTVQRVRDLLHEKILLDESRTVNCLQDIINIQKRWIRQNKDKEQKYD